MLRLSIAFAASLVATALGQDIPLAPQTTLEGTLERETPASYAIEVDVDTFVRGSVDQRSVDVVVRLIAPSGAALATIDGPARGAEHFSFESDDAGVYRIEVAPFEEEAGDYAIRLDVVEPVGSAPVDRARQLLSLYDRTTSPGVVASVWRDGEVLFEEAYGMANLTYDVPFTVDTPTNIGSTSKQFTAFAVMLLESRGALSLDDDIRTHISELPEFDEVVTIRHLLTHTSGYREFLNLLSMSGRRLDRGDSIDRSEIIAIVQAQPALQNSPGAEWNYNNTAFALAAMLVERVSGETFPDFMEKEVFAPLGMTSSVVRASQDQIVPGRAAGYAGSAAGYREVEDLGASMGAGGIYSTVGDLRRWVENFDQANVGTSEMFATMMTPYTLSDGKATGYGLGLFIDEQRGLKRIHHGGADTAHRSQLVYFPTIRAGVTVQSNDSSFNSGIAMRLASLFFDDAMPADDDEDTKVDDATASDFDPSSFDPADFDEFVGRYSLDESPSFVLTVTRDGSRFITQGSGQPEIDVIPTSPMTFSVVGVDAALTFPRNDDSRVDSLTLHQGGDHRATRLIDEDESSQNLSFYVGQYFSDELGVFATVALDGDALVLQRRRADDTPLSHTSGDAFSGGDMQIDFERSRTDKVIGMYLSNGRTRDVRFARMR